MLRTAFLAGVALALAAPAFAATIELHAGPVTLASDQVARTLVANAGTSSCRSRVIFSRNDVAADGSVGTTRQSIADAALLGGAGLVGVQTPNMFPRWSPSWSGRKR